ncbi:tetratricopeptide repeat protein [Humidesulfovibrio idahonensis]
MNKDFRNAALNGLIMTSLLMLPAGAHAAAKKAAKPAADTKTVQPAPTDSAYEQWLKKYGAYDRVAQPIDEISDTTSATALKRAEAHLLQGVPAQALAVVEGLKPYDDPGMEIHRLWLGGNAHRALGDPYKAVVWYSQAAKLMDAKQMKAKLSAEAGLDALWIDVWRRQYWAFVGNPSASREALELTLRTLQNQAETAWGKENFWIKSKEALSLATGETTPPAADKAAKDGALKVSDADRLRIAQAVAAASIEDYAQAKSILAKVGEPALRDFWGALLGFLNTGKTPDAKSIGAAGYAKAAGFWNANLLAAYSANRSEWLLGSSTASWTKFKANLSQLSKTEAQEAVDKEMQSLLISDEMSRLLRSLKFILTLEEGNTDAAKEIWDGLDKRKLPISLRVAGGLAFREELQSLLPQEIGAAGKLSPALAALLAAGGTGAPLAGEAPFWTRVEVGRSSNVNKTWPLDRLLVLSDWQARWVAGPGSELARRSAFLFPDTMYGYDCLVYLTQKAVENRAFQQAGTYLERMAALSTDKRRAAIRLGLKGKMERESGKDAEALATYQEIAELGVDMDPKTRLDMATFFQLKNDLDNGRKQLLILWEQHDKLPRNMQAEILFWLGEGEHSQRNYDAALDYYLRLAYQYPQEPMWPTVAMYRSAMIYEIKGNFETAKKLLRSVIATADTKEAQEAARNRLNALEAKAGKPSTKESGEPVYPF